MMGAAPWVTDANQALLTDLYQLTMTQAYWSRGMREEAVFTLFPRRLPATRNYLLACGLADALRYLETARFTDESIGYLETIPGFAPAFLRWLGDVRFTGDVYAVAEGTPVFGSEPILEVVAPLPEAQLAETFLMNQIHLQTVLASKASRVVAAAQGRPVIDFGLRRMHGTDAGVKSARAFHIAGVAATSNVLAGRLYGVPLAGTMAHSYIQASDSELDAFRDYAALYPETILLVDTYDTLQGVAKVIELAREMGDGFRIRGIRLDSGNLGELAVQARALLDAAGLNRLEIVVSGGLDEHQVAALVAMGAPIDGFGVGTDMGVSADAPSLDLVYKLASYGGIGRVKTSPGKSILPGRKQLYRIEENGRALRDVIAGAREAHAGRALLRPVMRAGELLPGGDEPMERARERAAEEVERLPAAVRALEPAEPAYPVEVSPALLAHQREVAAASG